MQTKTKTILLISITLIIGMVIGSLVTATMLRSYRYRDRIDRMRTPEGFVSKYEKIIEPAEEQKQQIRSMLLNHFELVDSTSKQFYGRMRNMRDSLTKELEPILTPEQKERWQRYQDRHKKRKYPHSYKKDDDKKRE